MTKTRDLARWTAAVLVVLAIAPQGAGARSGGRGGGQAWDRLLFTAPYGYAGAVTSEGTSADQAVSDRVTGTLETHLAPTCTGVACREFAQAWVGSNFDLKQARRAVSTVDALVRIRVNAVTAPGTLYPRVFLRVFLGKGESTRLCTHTVTDVAPPVPLERTVSIACSVELMGPVTSGFVSADLWADVAGSPAGSGRLDVVAGVLDIELQRDGQ